MVGDWGVFYSLVVSCAEYPAGSWRTWFFPKLLRDHLQGLPLATTFTAIEYRITSTAELGLKIPGLLCSGMYFS